MSTTIEAAHREAFAGVSDTDKLAITNLLRGKRKQAAAALLAIASVPDSVWHYMRQGLFGPAATVVLEDVQRADIADMIWEG